MAKVPNGAPEPARDPVTGQFIPAVDSAATNGATPELAPTTPDWDAIAKELELDPAQLSADDKDFVQIFRDAEAEGQAQTLEQLLAAGPETSLIPTATPEPVTPDPTAAVSPTTTGADGSVSGTTPDAADAGALSSGDAPANLTPVPEGLASPLPLGLGAFPGAPPVGAPAVPDPAPATPQMVQLSDGTVVPIEYARQMLEAQLRPPAQVPQPQPTFPAAPQQSPEQIPVPGAFNPDDYLDPQLAAVAFQQQQQIAQMHASQRALTEQLVERNQRESLQGMSAGVEAFQKARGVNDAERDYLINLASMNGTYQAYINGPYSGDPKSAAEAAMEASYWQVPELREREIQRLIQEQAAAAIEVERKKALGGAIQSSSGSAPRTASTAPPANREEALQGMAAALERDMAGQN